jgi:hypothetical protein
MGAILASFPTRQAQLGMHTTFPVNDQNEFTMIRIDIDHDFVNQ